MYNLCFYGIRRRFKAIPVGFWFSVAVNMTLRNSVIFINVIIINAQVAQAPKGAVNMTLPNSVIFIRVCMGIERS